jgi:hypothetical protein
MPSYKAPTSDQDRLTALEKARDTGTTDIAAGRKSITQETLDALKAFVPIFRLLFDALTKALSGRMKEVREREEARAVLDTYVRDFWEVLKRRAHRHKYPIEVLPLFGLDADGAVPVISTFDDLLHFADKIVKGEADAVAAGYPGMSNPGAAEVAAVLAAARTQAADVPTADRAYTDSQTAIAAQRPKADGYIEDVMADLNSSLRRYDPPTQRRIKRTYGATYETLPGEPDETAEPTPPTQPASQPGATPAPGGGA